MGTIRQWRSGLALGLWLFLHPEIAQSLTLEGIPSPKEILQSSDLVAAIRIRGLEKQPTRSGQKTEELVYVAEVIETLKGDATGTIRFRYRGMHLLLPDSLNLIVAESAGSSAGPYLVRGRPDCASPLLWKETISGARVLALPRATKDSIVQAWYDPQWSYDSSGTDALGTQADGSILLEDLRKQISDWTKSSGK